MADEGDYGQDYQARLNAAAIDRHRRQSRAPQAVNSSGLCTWCEEEIPEARRLYLPGCSLCVACQAMKERFPERMT